MKKTLMLIPLAAMALCFAEGEASATYAPKAEQATAHRQVDQNDWLATVPGQIAILPWKFDSESAVVAMTDEPSEPDTQ